MSWIITRSEQVATSPPPGVKLPWWDRSRSRRGLAHLGRAAHVTIYNPRYLTAVGLAILNAVLWPQLGIWATFIAIGIGVLALTLWAVRSPHSIQQSLHGWWRSNRRYRWTWQRTLRRCHASKLDVPTPLLLQTRSTRKNGMPLVDKLKVKVPTGLDPTTFQDYRGELLKWGWKGLSTRVYNPQSRNQTIELWNLINDHLIEPVQPYQPPKEPLPKHGYQLAMVEDGEPWLLKLRGGAAHCFVAGVSGSGKGSFIGSLLQQLQTDINAGTVRVLGIDPQASELGMWRHLFTKLVYTQTDAANLLEAEVKRMDERTRSMFNLTRQHTPTPGDELDIIIADEGLDLLDKTDRKTHHRITTAFGELLRKGRKASIVVVFMSQRAELDIIEFRKDFNNFIALRQAMASDVDMVLGRGALQAGANAHEITQPGVAYVKNEQGILRVRFPYMSDDDIKDLPPAPGNEDEANQPPPPVETMIGGFS